MAKQRHLIAVDTDEEVNVSIGGDKAAGWWFKVFHSLVDLGWWAYMTEGPKTLLVVLYKHANADRLCWPGDALLMRECRMSESGIYAAKRQLKAFGLIDARPGTGRIKTVYEMLEPRRPAPPGRHKKAEDTVPASIPPYRGKAPDPGKGPVSGEALGGAAHKPAALSRVESRLLERTRSNSEQINRLKALDEGRELEQAGLGEIDKALASLTPAALADLKAIAVQTADESLRPFLARADPLKNPMLRVRIHQLLTGE